MPIVHFITPFIHQQGKQLSNYFPPNSSRRSICCSLFVVLAQAMFGQAVKNQLKPDQMLTVAWMGSVESSLGETGFSSTSVKPGFRPQRTRCHDMHDIEKGRQYQYFTGVHVGVLFEWPKIDTYLLAELSARGPHGEAWQTCQCQLTHAMSRADLLPRGAELRLVPGVNSILAAPSAVCKLAESNLLNGKTYRLFSRNCHVWATILIVETALLSNIMTEIVQGVRDHFRDYLTLFPGKEMRVWLSYALSNAVALYGILIPFGLPERGRQIICEGMTGWNNKRGFLAKVAADFGLTTMPDSGLLLNELFPESDAYAAWWACGLVHGCAIWLPHVYSVDVSEEARCIIFRSKLEKLEPVFEKTCSSFPSHAPQIDQLRETVLKFAEGKAPQAFLVKLRCRNDPHGTLQNWAYENNMLDDNPGAPPFTLKADKWKVLCTFFNKAYNDGGEFIVNFWFQLHRSLVSATQSFYSRIRTPKRALPVMWTKKCTRDGGHQHVPFTTRQFFTVIFHNFQKKNSHLFAALAVFLNWGWFSNSFCLRCSPGFTWILGPLNRITNFQNINNTPIFTHIIYFSITRLVSLFAFCNPTISFIEFGVPKRPFFLHRFFGVQDIHSKLRSNMRNMKTWRRCIRWTCKEFKVRACTGA